MNTCIDKTGITILFLFIFVSLSDYYLRCVSIIYLVQLLVAFFITFFSSSRVVFG